MKVRVTKTRGSLLAVCVWSLAAVQTLPVRAEQTTRDAAYESAIGDALAEMKLGHLPEARALFLKAHELRPSARTLRGLGVVALELRRYAEADRLLRRALDEPRRPLTDKQRAEVQQALARLDVLVGRYAVTLSPANAELRVDGELPVLEDGQLLLEIGRHTLIAMAPSHDPYHREIEVRGGERESLSIALAEVPVVATVTAPIPSVPVREQVPAQLPQKQAAPHDGKRADRVVGFTLVTISSAVAVTGGTLLALGLRDVSKVERADDGTRWSSLEGANERAPVLTTAGAVGLGVGLAGASLGLWFLQRKARARRDAVDIAVSPYGISLHGRI